MPIPVPIENARKKKFAPINQKVMKTVLKAMALFLPVPAPEYVFLFAPVSLESILSNAGFSDDIL
jgi:hypothetical protein